MQFFIVAKQLGKRKPLLEPQAFQIMDLPEKPTLRLLIEAVVRSEVERFNAKEVGIPVLPFLRNEQIDLGAEMGKIGFGTRYGASDQDFFEAVDNALTAFQDGLFAVFIDDEAVPNLETPIVLTSNSQVLFLRLTLLAGR